MMLGMRVGHDSHATPHHPPMEKAHTWCSDRLPSVRKIHTCRHDMSGIA
jgi:hypothetical protein